MRLTCVYGRVATRNAIQVQIASRGSPTLAVLASRLLSLILAMLFFRLCWFCVRRIGLVDELADVTRLLQTQRWVSHLAHRLWPFLRQLGCDCLSCIICRIPSMSLDGSWTSACASARRLSKAIATSISHPSFLITAERPVCIQV